MSEWMNLSINHFFYQFISPFISLFAENPVLVLLTLWSITAYFYSDFLSLNNFSKLCTTLTDFLFSRNMSLYSDTNRPFADLPSSEVTDCGPRICWDVLRLRLDRPLSSSPQIYGFSFRWQERASRLRLK